MKKALLLFVLGSFKGERTIYGALHIFQGKKTAQAIQDSHFYSLLPFFNLMPQVTRDEIETMCRELVLEGLIRLDHHHAYLTESGNHKCDELFKQYPYLKKLNGLKYLHQTNVFWLRLTLLIQTATHLLGENKHFIPITSNRGIQQWVKARMKQHRHGLQSLVENLYNECEQFLTSCTNEQATAFVIQLSSRNRIGLTAYQTAELLNTEALNVEIMTKATLHSLFNELETGVYPTLSVCMDSNSTAHFSTDTTNKTARLLREGFSISQIMQARRLKQSTIEDHVVELALYDPHFSIRPYVSIEENRLIINAAMERNTFKLKELREHLGDDYTYFKIRLALTRKE